MDFLWRITGGNGAETDVHHVISSLRKDVESLTADIRQKEEDQHILETERSTIFESSQRSLEQAFDIHTSIEKANADLVEKLKARLEALRAEEETLTTALLTKDEEISRLSKEDEDTVMKIRDAGEKLLQLQQELPQYDLDEEGGDLDEERETGEEADEEEGDEEKRENGEVVEKGEDKGNDRRVEGEEEIEREKKAEEKGDNVTQEDELGGKDPLELIEDGQTEFAASRESSVKIYNDRKDNNGNGEIEEEEEEDEREGDEEEQEDEEEEEEEGEGADEGERKAETTERVDDRNAETGKQRGQEGLEKGEVIYYRDRERTDDLIHEEDR